MNKNCAKCLKLKPLVEFYKNNTMAEGYTNKCKICVREAQSLYRRGNVDKIRETDRSRPNKIERNSAKRLYAQANKHKSEAQKKAVWAAHKGVIKKKPCEVCGDPRVEMHHPDYSRPLEVMFLCKVHHCAEHKRVRDQRPG